MKRLPAIRSLLPLLAAAMLSACGSASKQPTIEPLPTRPGQPAQPAIKPPASAVPVLPPAGSGRGAYYQDDGPGDKPPEGLLATPDAEPVVEPYSRRGNRPYVVFGKTYTPITDDRPLVQRGVGSWYGKKFHGQKTSSGELYDMYKMTAAHTTLPIPSYARVTNLSNGAQVIVRVNDRGPFHANRIIDLSYTAALRLGYLGKGSSELQVERLLPEDIAKRAAAVVEKASASRTAAVEMPAVASVVTLPVTVPSAPVEVAVVEKGTGSSDADERQAILAGFIAKENTAAEVKTNAAPVASVAQAVSDNFHLQLGAFGDPTNAESAHAQLKKLWDAVLPPIEFVRDGNLYRIFSGPFASRALAAEAAQKLMGSGAQKPLIVQR